LAKKKVPLPKKKKPEKRTLIEQFLQVFDHILSYFEVLFVYLRKSLNLGIQKALGLFALFLYLGFLNLTGSLLMLYGIYQQLLEYFQQNQIYASLSLGFALFSLSGILIILVTRKLSI